MLRQGGVVSEVAIQTQVAEKRGMPKENIAAALYFDLISQGIRDGPSKAHAPRESDCGGYRPTAGSDLQLGASQGLCQTQLNVYVCSTKNA